jgi:hypothetical protein
MDDTVTTLPGDVYIKRLSVYRILTYDESNDMVLLATTNDVITLYGKTSRLLLRQNDFHLCPYQLLDPAVQVFELDEKFSEKSLKSLRTYRSEHLRVYKRLGLPDLFQDVEDARTRTYTVPEEQGEQFPDLKGKTFDVLVPFICITKDMYKARFHERHFFTGEDYYSAMRHREWPIFFVPSRFEQLT